MSSWPCRARTPTIHHCSLNEHVPKSETGSLNSAQAVLIIRPVHLKSVTRQVTKLHYPTPNPSGEATSTKRHSGARQQTKTTLLLFGHTMKGTTGRCNSRSSKMSFGNTSDPSRDIKRMLLFATNSCWISQVDGKGRTRVQGFPPRYKYWAERTTDQPIDVAALRRY